MPILEALTLRNQALLSAQLGQECGGRSTLRLVRRNTERLTRESSAPSCQRQPAMARHVSAATARWAALPSQPSGDRSPTPNRP